jgi:hypothetical protein
MENNPHRLHAQLSTAIKVAARVRDELNSSQLSTWGRIGRQLYHVLLVWHVTCILHRIRRT